jgi:hypothetical protein
MRFYFHEMKIITDHTHVNTFWVGCQCGMPLAVNINKWNLKCESMNETKAFCCMFGKTRIICGDEHWKAELVIAWASFTGVSSHRVGITALFNLFFTMGSITECILAFLGCRDCSSVPVFLFQWSSLFDSWIFSRLCQVAMYNQSPYNKLFCVEATN